MQGAKPAGQPGQARPAKRKDEKEQEPPDTATTAASAAIAPAPAANRWINVEDIPEPVKEAKTIRVVPGAALKDRQKGGQSDDASAADEENIKSSSTGRHPSLPSSGMRKDSVSSETALLREIDEPEPEEDRSPPSALEADDPAMQDDDDERSQSRSRYKTFKLFLLSLGDFHFTRRGVQHARFRGASQNEIAHFAGGASQLVWQHSLKESLLIHTERAVFFLFFFLNETDRQVLKVI